VSLAARPDRKDLETMKELLESGRVVPLIEKSFPLEQAAEAFRHLGERHALGKVVITVEHTA
jgi:NADPH:quinone reductase-like Zn-dependent oxidoreductase